VLNHLHYNCGDADGDFGKKTFKALKKLQANNLITIDGEYGNESMAVIENLLQS
jgi:peptidoglycan hydrolase-like protein with peptidoglycan-binding domain